MVATLLERRLTSRQVHLRDALVDLVLSQGFSHLTMDQFAAQLNCSKRSLYALAWSKEQLAVLVVRHFFYDWDSERPSSLQIERIGEEVEAKDRSVASDVAVSRQISFPS